MNVQIDNYYKTTDLCLCASLLSYGYNLESVFYQDDSKRATFIIAIDDRIDVLIKGYWAKNLRVEPITFFNYLKEVKNRIYGGK